MLWEVCLALLSLWACLRFWKKRKFYHLAKQFPIGFKRWPLIGHAYMFLGNEEDRMTAFKEIGREILKQGGVSSAWLGGRLFILVADPVVAEFILKNCLEKDDVVRLSQYVLGNGSIFAPVSIWRPRRKILAPNFNQKNLFQFVHIFAKQSEIMVEKLKSKVGTGPFPLWNYLTTYTMDSVCETTLGVQMEAQKNPDQPFLKAFDSYCQLITTRMLRPWLHNEMVYKLVPDFKRLTEAKNCMDSFISNIIKNKRRELKITNKFKKDEGIPESQRFRTFLELLIESSGGDRGYSDQELQEEILVLAMAGTDTSAVATCFTAVMLSWYSNVQDKVYDELTQIFEGSSRPVTPDDLPRLKYLDAVIKETMRLYPPVPLAVRKVTSDVTLPSGLTLPKGCGVMTSIWAMHRNTKYWGDDAEDFRPERFLEAPLRHPAQFHAFSYGPRNCVGYQYAMMSAKTALATLLRQFRVEPAHQPIRVLGVKPKYEPLKLKMSVMMKDADDFMVQLKPRV